MGFAATTEQDAVGITWADVNGFTLAELRFPPGYVQAAIEPEQPYFAVVLEGAVEKSFPRGTMQLAQADAVTMPAGELHGARFGANGARIVIVKVRDPSSPLAGCLERLVDLRAPGISWLAWRLSGELRAADAAAPLAAEGLALELLAATRRDAERLPTRTPPWLRAAEELLRERAPACAGLGEVADAVGVHPTHLARVFRARHGVSVGEYARRLRLGWAAAELAGGDTPLASVAAQAGFADQSHFTRDFKRHIGTTPARYRRQTRA